jgi:hypothetical protein
MCPTDVSYCPVHHTLRRRSGKCIGEKNIKAFYWFTSLLCFQTYYLMGSFIYFIVYLAANAPAGDKF